MLPSNRFLHWQYWGVACAAVLALCCIGCVSQPTTEEPVKPLQAKPASDTKYLIRLRGYEFDPLVGEPDLPKDLRIAEPPRGPAHYIIQFRKSLTREERTRVRSRFGLQLLEYVPNYSFLEKVEPATLAKLESEPLYRAKVLYHPAFKIDPEIGQRDFVSTRRREEPQILLMALAFEDTPADEAAARLRQLGVEVVSTTNEPESGILRFVVRVRRLEDSHKIAHLESIRFVEEVGDITLNNGTTSWVLQTNANGSRTIWAQQLRGENQIIGHIDGSIDLNHCFFRDNVDNTPRPGHRKVVGVRNAGGGSISQDHGTFSAGSAVGEDVNNDALSMTPNANNGNAPRARLTHGYLYDLDWTGGSVSFYNYLNRAHADGAAIHTNSWDDKTTSAYTELSVMLDRFTFEQEDALVIIGPDNAGTIRPPDTAKNALVVNATQQAPNQNNFSSGVTMFTLDGRRKPDLMAPGASIVSADGGTMCGTRTDGGTSFAAPAVAGLAALVKQYYAEGFYPTGARQPHHGFACSGALMKATLLNGTVDATGIAGYPGTDATGEGWGRVLAENALYFLGDARNLQVWDVRHADGLTTGDSNAHTVQVAANAEPLKITLVWTEPPGMVSSATPVVNDLDLRVTSPDGTQTFLGNRFVGGMSATGGASDTLNNVEMVLINNPAVGDWTITVNATAVNVGRPDQGYALVATGDFPEPPPPTGVQDTLVVRVKFSDLAFEPALPNLQNKMTEVVGYFDEVAYGQVSINPTYRGPITLDHDRAYYYHPERNPLIELTEELVAKLVASEPSLFDTIERMIIVTNDPSFARDWATTGPWPYELPGGLTRPISVSIQSYDNSVARFAHGLSHQFNLVDLYAHEGVVFPRAYVDEWDNMGGLYNNAHPLVWSKERGQWVSSHGSTIEYVPRPAAGGSLSQTFGLFNQESTGVNRKAIAIGLTPGAASVDQEDNFYFIEARDNALGGHDDVLPQSGVLIYHVNELIRQGEGPVIVRDNDLATGALNDAAFAIGDSESLSGTGISVDVNAGTGGADYDIAVNYTAPVTDYNVSITKGETLNGQFYSYFSPDIWVDSPKNGWNLSGGPPPHDEREQPLIGEVNRIYARIRNGGPGTSFDFDVAFRISEPYHTVGGVADFDKFVGIQHVTSFAPGTSPMIIPPVEWTPEPGNPHACLWVEIVNLVGNDTNPHDNAAQENLQKVTSTSSSPYQPVTYKFGLTNPYDDAALFYFRAEAVPKGWNAVLAPRKIRLDPAQKVVASLTVTPPPEAKVCTSHLIQVTSWTPRGDTLISVGGGAVQVDLRRPTILALDTGLERCRDQDAEEIKARIRDWQRFPTKHVPDIDIAEILKNRCQRVTARGCTDPPLRDQEVIVRFEGPDGEPIYHTVKTDENGCFEDFLVVTDEGDWTVTAEYGGDKCQAPEVTRPRNVCWCP